MQKINAKMNKCVNAYMQKLYFSNTLIFEKLLMNQLQSNTRAALMVVYDANFGSS